jgi:F-type H+-transporting ATPase subunit alpha
LGSGRFLSRSVAIVFAGTRGFLDDLEVSGLGAFEKHLFGYLDSSKRELLSDIAERKVLDEDLTARLEAAIREAKEGFAQAKGAA